MLRVGGPCRSPAHAPRRPRPHRRSREAPGSVRASERRPRPGPGPRCGDRTAAQPTSRPPSRASPCTRPPICPTASKPPPWMAPTSEARGGPASGSPSARATAPPRIVARSATCRPSATVKQRGGQTRGRTTAFEIDGHGQPLSRELRALGQRLVLASHVRTSTAKRWGRSMPRPFQRCAWRWSAPVAHAAVVVAETDQAMPGRGWSRMSRTLGTR